MSESPSFQNLPQNVKYKILTYFYENDNNFGWSQMSCHDEDIRKLIIFFIKMRFSPEMQRKLFQISNFFCEDYFFSQNSQNSKL